MIPLYDEQKTRGYTPFVNILIIITSTVIFLFSFLRLEEFIDDFAFIPAQFFEKKDFLPIFSSMFLHGGLGHLLSNMWSLWIFGNNLEKKLGRIKFLIFYLFCGLGAALFYAIFTDNPSIPVIGASGAISGILGGYFILFPKNKILTLIPGPLFFHIISLPAILFGIIWFFFQFLSLGSNINIAFLAHIGGFLFGALLIKQITRK